MSNNTLESQHKLQIKKFDNNHHLVNKNDKKIQSYKDELKKLDSKKKTEKNIKRKIFLEKEIKNLTDKMEDIKENKDKFKYYLNTMDIFEQYYTKKQVVDTKQTNNFFKKGKVINKTNLYNQYLNKLNKNNIDEKNEKISESIICENCNKRKILNYTNSIYVCTTCGHCTHIITESEKPNYSESSVEISQFSYQRFTHFREWLNQFRAIETTNIPDEVYDKIMNEIKKEKIKDLKVITYEKIKKILKKIGFTKYYEHSYHILNKITGIPPPTLSNELVRELEKMFRQIQEPFSKVCPEERVNFLRYSYVIRKFLELLEEESLIKHFPLLKSREVLYKQDKIWKAICNQLNWTYYASI